MSTFNAALAAQLGALDVIAPRKGGKFAPKPKQRYKPQPEVKHAKAGTFTWKIKNASGKLFPKTSPRLRGIIMDYGFRFQDFGMNPEGKYQTFCATTSHTELNNEGQQVQGDGWWKIPNYDHETIFKMFSPVGAKMDPELVDDEGKPVALTCERCHSLGLNLEKPGEPFHKDSNKVKCKDDGYVVVSVISEMDPETEKWRALEEPRLMTLAWGRLSNDTYTKYLRKLMVENRANPEDVITEFSIGSSDKYGNYKPEMIAEFPDAAIQPVVDAAKALYVEGLTQWKAERQEYVDRMNAERLAAKGEAGPGTVTNIEDKRAAKPVGGVKVPPKATTAKAAPVAEVEDDEELPF